MTASPTRKKELLLILCFLGIIAAVPITQVLIESQRGERIQFTDAFRYRPTAKNLRQYERTLEDKSWFQKNLRPLMQQALFDTLHDTGTKAILGREGWLFYRPDVRYLVEPNRRETDDSDSKWVRPADGSTRRDSVVRTIVQFRNQLKERGIELLIMPIPGKPSIYPDRLTRRAVGWEPAPFSPTLELLAQLRQEDIASVDLFTRFCDWRKNHPQAPGTTNLYLKQDTHWTPLGAKLAAEAVAQSLHDLGWAPPATNQFVTKRVRVNRQGDIVEMLQLPKPQSILATEAVECEQISDPALGLLVPAKSDRPGAYKYPAQKSTILVLGDSFCRIYQLPEPQSLGELNEPSSADKTGAAETVSAKRLLPGSAGFISHLAFALKTPVDAIVSDGGASTDVRRKLSTNPEILETKKVVIWEFVERDINLGRDGWEQVSLPPKLDQ
jgi:hypothetical protein